MLKDKWGKIWLVLILLIIIGFAWFAYRTKAQIHAELYSWKLIPMPAQFTELYFANASFLPTATVAKQPTSFAFTIHNLEGETMVYPYVVYFQYPDGSEVMLQTGTVSLPDEASTTIAVSHIFKSSNIQGEIVVNLVSLDQAIDFLMSNPNQ